MTAIRTPSRASPIASLGTTTSPDAALQGASNAFGRPPPKQRAPSNTYAGTNGALVAAKVAGVGKKTPSPNRSANTNAIAVDPLKRNGQVRGPQSSAYDTIPQIPQQSIANSTVSPPARIEHSRSPSHFAAALAAARASPAVKAASGRSGSTRPTIQPSQERANLLPSQSVPKRVTAHRKSKPTVPVKKATLSEPSVGVNDARHIPATTSLVAFFERRSVDAGKSSSRPEPIIIKPSEPISIKSPKPVRTSGVITSIFEIDLANEPVQPPPLGASDVSSRLTSEEDTELSSDSYASASEAPILPVTKPKRSLAVSPAPKPPMSRKPLPSSDRVQVSVDLVQQPHAKPISVQQPPPPSMNSSKETIPSSRSIAAAFHQMHPRRVTPLTTGDSLANAMVAGSLASSRAPSPTKLPNPPIIRRGKAHTFNFARTPSPCKHGMRHTMRSAPPSSESEDETLHPYGKHKKKRLMRKHPNKHHEGDRKRWRDAVTERERRRYEGVWAANKGLHVSFTPRETSDFERAPESKSTIYSQEAAADSVSNIVARDIWTRSRLPDHVLQDVWDLVDTQGLGRLKKDEFVVGLWLIDQRLKGRKLPVKVHESVWASVKILQGIKFRKGRV